MTRAEHLAWAKQRAHEELDRKGVPAPERCGNAMASMLSDLRKHPELEASVRVGVMAMLAVNTRDRESCVRFIDGFN